ncbi:MAG: GldG family protein [bacterium]
MNINRKTKQGINVFYTIAIIAGILILINYIASSIFFHFDITQNKDYSVSQVSKDTVKNLDDIINIKGFFSKQAPSNLISAKQEIKDIIDVYRNYSNGKIKVTYVDPKDDDKTLQEARNLGIPELQFSSLANDKYEVSTGYLGLAVIYGTKKEVIPVLDSTNDLEYQLTSAIKKVMQKEDYTVAFLKGQGELEKDQDLTIASQNLQKLYNVQVIDFANGDLIPDNVNTLIIAGAKEAFSPRDKYIIDQFLMKGKSILFLQENIDVGDMLQASPNKSGIGDLLEHYGVKLNNNFILDPSCEMASFSSGFSQFFTSYPFWPKVLKNGFNKDSVIVSQLESAVFPWTSSVEIAEKNAKDKEITELIKTTANSWAEENSKNLSPQRNDFTQDNKGEKTLAVFVSGKFSSYFNDKEKPVKKPSEDAGMEENTKDEQFIKETSNGRIIVVGDSDFARDGFLKRFNANILFFQNAVDALTMDESLITIRSKGVSDRPIKELSDSMHNSIKFFNIFGLTIIVLIAGLLRYFLRKKRKFSDQI